MSSSTLNIDKIKAQTYLNDACNRIKEAYEFLNMQKMSLASERFAQADEAYNKAKKHNWENYSASCIQMFETTETEEKDICETETKEYDEAKARTHLNYANNRIKEAYEFLNMEEESLTLERFGQANEAFNKAKKHNWEN